MNIVESVFIDVPPITRILCVFSGALTFLVYIDYLKPHSLYFNLSLILNKMQVNKDVILNVILNYSHGDFLQICFFLENST